MKLNREDIYSILQNSFLLHGVESTVILKYIYENGKILNFNKGESIRSTDQPKSIGFVLSGKVNITKLTVNHSKVILNTLQKGNVFDAATVFLEKDIHITKIEAVTTSSVLFLSQDILKELIQKDSKIAMNYIKFLSDRVCFLNDKIDSFTATDAENKLLTYLKSNIQLEGQERFVDVSFGFLKLSKMLNMGRASLYRALDALEQKNMIKKEQKKIIVLNINEI